MFLCCANGNASGHSLKGIENVIGPLQSSRKLSTLLEGGQRKSWSHERASMFVQTAASLGTLVVFRGLAKGAVGFQRGRLPMWEPQVTIAKNCRFREVGTTGSQPRNHGLPLQATAGYQRLELMLPNLGPIGYLSKNLSSSRLELTVPNVGTFVHYCKELPVPRPETYGSQPRN